MITKINQFKYIKENSDEARAVEMVEYLLKNLKTKENMIFCTEEILGALYDEGIKEDAGTRPFWYSVQIKINEYFDK